MTSVSAAAVCLAIGLQYLIQGNAPTAPFSRVGLFVAALAIAVVGAIVSAGLAWAPAPRTASGLGTITASTALLIAVQAGLLLLWVPAVLVVWTFDGDLASGWTYKLLNKRWLAALYLWALGVVLVLPAAYMRFFGAIRPASEETSQATAAANGRPTIRVVSVAVLLAVVGYVLGPPWHMERHHRGIDFHEQVHLGPLQAIDKGYLPFVGPASTQYGPGSQVLTYAIMRLSGHFDVVGHREAQAWLQLAAAGVLVVVGYLCFGFWRTLAAFPLALAFSPLGFLLPSGDGTLAGSYGWGNPWRYLGTFVVVAFTGRLMVATASEWIWRFGAVAIGLTWGLFSWVSQENFSSTLSATGLLVLLLLLTATCTLRRAAELMLGMAGGAAVVWAAVLGWYAWHGAAMLYLDNYFLVAGAIAKGFSNTWWSDDASLYPAYLLTAPFALAIGWAILWDVRTGSLRTRLNGRAVALLAMVCVLLACYQTALFRSDGEHLRNTMIALPFVVVFAVVDLPRWSAPTLGRFGLRLAIVAVVLWLYPFAQLLRHPIQSIVLPPLARFRVEPLPVLPDERRVPFRRAGLRLSDEPMVAAGGPPMRDFLEFADRLRSTVGDRKIYISDSLFVYSSLYYFIADLTPAPFLGDREIMLINNDRVVMSQEVMRRRISQFECLLTVFPDGEEARIFLVAYPNARVERLELAGKPFFAFLSAPGRSS